jgi:hypothetical protein
MIRQVRMREVYTDAMGVIKFARVFAFGTHVDATTKDYPALGPNVEITAAAAGQPMRIILDELLVGNSLEEVECRGLIDGVSVFDRVPLGTTPDDIAKCSTAKDILPSSCPGTFAHAVCICRADAGCGDVAKGQPVGVRDVNQDGSADNTRFIAGAAGVKCGNIDVPIDLDGSYWNPSGDQNKPAMGGFDALGPAIVLAASGAFPTGLECQLSFAADVVDKQGERICAPANGDVNAGCAAGDMGAFKFKVETLRVTPGFVNNGTGVSTTMPLTLITNAPVATTTLSAVTVETMAGTPVTGVVVTTPQPTQIKLEFTTPLTPMTTYNVKITTALTDAYGQALPQMVTFTFTTGA